MTDENIKSDEQQLSPRQRMVKLKRLMNSEMKLKLKLMELEAEIETLKDELAAKQQEIAQARQLKPKVGGNGSN
jgi:predicted RNase H-like nuclease (RuvC/YqgF family)